MIHTVLQAAAFAEWLDALKDRRAQARIAFRLRQAEAGNLGDWKSLGAGLAEMRVDTGPGYRLYFTQRGRTIVVMLAGGDKSTQPRDIARARRLLDDLGDEP